MLPVCRPLTRRRRSYPQPFYRVRQRFAFVTTRSTPSATARYFGDYRATFPAGAWRRFASLLLTASRERRILAYLLTPTFG